MPLSPIREITTLDSQPLLPTFNTGDDSYHPQITKDIDFNFAGKDTQHSTHAIHPYVAAINPPLARALISHYVPEGAAVLDPFCGGGGVLVEALLSDHRGEGCDINPLAVLISRVKTTRLPYDVTVQDYTRILNEALANHDVDVDDIPDLIRYWYTPKSLAPLYALRSAINRTANPQVRELFQVVLSATARDVMLTYRGEIRLRKLQGKDLEKFQPDVFSAFRKRAELALTRVAQLPEGRRARVYLCDARQIDDAQLFHTVITSPPYADDTNGVGYFQFSRNMLYWIGISLDEQKEQRRSFLGCGDTNVVLIDAPPSETLAGVVAVIAQRNQTHHKQALHFYYDYYSALGRISRTVEARAIIIIGDRVLSRTHINNGRITTELINTLGFELEHYYTRQITKKRIPNLGGDGGGTSVEHILVYRRR
jgi:site-specific DNA-methyltransferase (cytosine-N4-specific)